MRNNKVVLSLVVASIAAMASVPELLKQEKSDDSKKDVIDLKKTEAKTEEQKQLSADVKSQMDTMWSKKTPATKVGESVDVLVDNYGSGDKNIKSKIYDDLKLAQYVPPPRPTNLDSSNIAPAGGWSNSNVPHGVANYATTYVACHAACHGACHSACHGSRGWRKTN